MSFMRQGTWMMFSNTFAGLLMFGVHLMAPAMMGSAGEYGLFVALLGMLHLVMSLAPGIQTVFAHESAAASTSQQRCVVGQRAMAFMKGCLGLWVVSFALVWIARNQVFDHFKFQRFFPLGVILVAGLFQLWLPILMGILQGCQRFTALGWALLIHGGGRLAIASVLIVVLGGSADAAIMGVLGGIFVALIWSTLGTRGWWVSGSSHAPLLWGRWMRDMGPMILAPVIFQLMLVADMLFFRSITTDLESNYYGLAGTIGRGMVMFLGPLVGVMFPKLVLQRAQEINDETRNALVGSTLKVTLLVGGLIGGFFLLCAFWWGPIWQAVQSMESHPVVGTFIQRLLTHEVGFKLMISLLPWFAGGMLCLCCSQVLMSRMLAEREYRSLIRPLLIVFAYLISLGWLPDNVHEMVQLVCIFNAILLCVLWVSCNRARQRTILHQPPSESSSS